MRPDARTIDRLLSSPGAIRAVLLHGDDSGLVRERGSTLARAVAGSLDDPFRIASLDRDTHDRIEEEAAALSLTGGRRVVRVRDAGDALAPAITRLLAAPGDTLVILEAPSLPGRSKLRGLLEPRPDAAVIPCYPEEGRVLGASVEAMVREGRVRITPDALALLSSVLGADRLASRSEVEKLVLYAGEGGTIDAEAVDACVADASSLSLEDALFAATEGDLAGADRAFERALADGAAPVAIIRMLGSHLSRLAAARRPMEEAGLSAADAAKSARPPVFFKRVPAFTRALGRWSLASLARAAAEAQDVELACKRTGAPDLALVRHLVARVARAAAARRPA